MRFIMGVVRFVITIAVLGASGYFVYDFVMRQNERSGYNKAIELVNHGKLDEAVEKLKVFMNSSDPDVAATAKGELIKVYKRLGDDVSKPTKVSAEFYELAAGLDPDCLEDKQMRLLDAHRKFKHGTSN